MIAATIEGPSYAWRPNNDESSIEVFATLEDAVVALMERYYSNGRTYCTVRTLDGKAENVLFPAFDLGTLFTCYTVAGALEGRPAEDQVLDALAEVHSQVWTWTLTLSRNEDSGRLAVVVEANR
jgi:hypothetical protein